jgi:FtsP/CotA-like multicopper oxidase with cupredoxin domain
MLTRRRFVAGAAGLLAVGAALGDAGAQARYTRRLGPTCSPEPGKTVQVLLSAAERPTALPCFGGRALPLWTFTGEEWPPLIRLNLGDTLEATLENRLPRPDESTSVHWHGIRLPNSQDGVPFLVQLPVQPGETFRYEFTPPDPGTFFFHTHCNSTEQLGRGLEGILIIDGDTTEPYDADQVLLLRDWQVDLDAGRFNSFYTLRGAARAGTYAPLHSANGMVNPEIPLPANGDCRLRLINTDTTRIMLIGVEGADAAIVAVDGMAVQPFTLATWSLGPAMRVDIVLRAPPEGGTARLMDQSPTGRVELAHFIGQGAGRPAREFDPAPLRASRVAEPDIRHAQRLAFEFQSSLTGKFVANAADGPGGTLGSLCLSQKVFWTINGRPWPDRDHARLPAPLAVLKRGLSYIFVLKNASDFAHPIHIHGHTFRLLRSSKQRLPQCHTDTLLLLPNEQAEVAFVADNPGDWMFHCHIIEHQESGMMGYFRVA